MTSVWRKGGPVLFALALLPAGAVVGRPAGAWASPVFPPTYRVSIIPAPKNSAVQIVGAMNDVGDVLGDANYGTDPESLKTLVFVYRDGVSASLGPPAGFCQTSYGAGPDNDGTFAVIASACAGSLRPPDAPFRGQLTGAGVRWTRLVGPAGQLEWGFPTEINSSGDVVGGIGSTKVTAVWPAGSDRAVIHSLKSPPGWVGSAGEIDDDGDLVGELSPCGWNGDCPESGAVWVAGKGQPLLMGGPDGSTGEPAGLATAPNGTILLGGQYVDMAEQPPEARDGLWELTCNGPGERPDLTFGYTLPLLAGYKFTRGGGPLVTRNGEIVGEDVTATGDTEEYVFESGRIASLDALVPSEYRPLGGFSGLNDLGQVAANTRLLTPTILQPAYTNLFHDSFDCQTSGRPWTGSFADRFSSTAARRDLEVSSAHWASGPHSLQVHVVPGRAAYGRRYYGTAVSDHELNFSLRLDEHLRLPRGRMVTIAETGAEGSPGDVALEVGHADRLWVRYLDAAGHERDLWSGVHLARSAWDSIQLRENLPKRELELAVDGRLRIHATGLNLPGGDVAWVAVGNCARSHARGLLYFDDIYTTTQIAGPVP